MVECADTFSPLFAIFECIAEASVGIGEFGILSDGLSVIDDGFGHLILVAVHIADFAVEFCAGFSFEEAECLCVGEGGAFVLGLIGEGITDHFVCFDQFGVEAKGFLEVSDGALPESCFKEEGSASEVYFGDLFFILSF